MVTKGRLQKILFISLLKELGALVKPNGILVNLCLGLGKMQFWEYQLHRLASASIHSEDLMLLFQLSDLVPHLAMEEDKHLWWFACSIEDSLHIMLFLLISYEL